MTISTEKKERGDEKQPDENEGHDSEIPMVKSRGNAVRKKKSAKE